MDKYPDFNTHAQFHAAYLKELFKAKNINYSKKNPGDVLKPYYIEQLLKRIKDQNQHLPSFQTFIEFCNTIRLKISN